MSRAAAPEGRTYIGVREPSGCTVGYVDQERPRVRKLPPCLYLANHSPTGFEWGYGGSGPAQLALALVADATGDDALALRVYQQFKAEIVQGLPHDRWMLTAGEIAKFAGLLRRAGENA